MAKKKQRILLIDGNALIHRAYHAVPPLTTRDGELVNAVFGFISVLLRAIKDLDPTHIVVAFDKKAPTFRHKIYKEYKAKRPAADKELYQQFPKVREVVEAFNIPHFEIAGYEADDIIGTLTKKCGIENIIVTGDLDALQLVNNGTKVYTMRKGVGDTVLYGKDEVMKRYGLKPSQLLDYKALRGDPSDNIPGVPGIGEKTAVKLLQEFGSLDNLYKALNKEVESDVLKTRIVKLLLENKDKAILSKRLGKIITDINLDFDLQKSELKDYDRDEVIELFQKLGFKSLLTRLPESNGDLKQSGLFEESDEDFDMKSICEKKGVAYEIVNTGKGLDDLVKKMIDVDELAFDTETTSTNALEAKLLGISFCWEENVSYYVVMESESFVRKLKPIFENIKIKKIAHNLKYDLEVMRQVGIKIKGKVFDTMIASYILNPGTRRHGLDDLAFSEFGYEMMSFEMLVGKGKAAKKITDIEDEKLAFYSGEDVDFTFRLYKKFSNQLDQGGKLEKIFKDIEMPLIPVLAMMERNGIKINVDFLKKLSSDFGLRLQGLEIRIYELAGCRFNVRSTMQLKEVLFDKLKISTDDIKKIKTGFSTAASELVKLRQVHPIISLIEEHRELSKLKNTYLDALPKLVASDGRVHTSFNQTITVTGRLSSSEPNLQNIPIKSDAGEQIRKAFVADSNNKILALDYSQIELRIMAHMSGDVNMIKAFEEGEDIHSAMAAKIFKKEIKDVSKKERRAAKTINFGIMYGMSAYGLSQSLGISRKEAQKMIDDYFEQFPTIGVFMKQTLEKARETGYVETLFGRRRYVPELKGKSWQAKAAAERMAVNMPIQGTAADIIKMAMISVSRMLLESDFSNTFRMILQVHDELVFEVEKDKVDEFAEKIKDIMENIYKLEVPLVVDIGVGDNWGALSN